MAQASHAGRAGPGGLSDAALQTGDLGPRVRRLGRLRPWLPPLGRPSRSTMWASLLLRGRGDGEPAARGPAVPPLAPPSPLPGESLGCAQRGPGASAASHAPCGARLSCLAGGLVPIPARRELRPGIRVSGWSGSGSGSLSALDGGSFPPVGAGGEQAAGPSPRGCVRNGVGGTLSRKESDHPVWYCLFFSKSVTVRLLC